MLERKTVIDQVEISGEGEVRVRLAFLILDDGVEISRKYHRTAFDPDGPTDVVEQQMAQVNAHLGMMKELPVEASAIALVRGHNDLARVQRKALKDAGKLTKKVDVPL